jgi:FtsZ-binding cell division protein ZapB
MPKLNLDGIDYDASQEVINSHKKLTSRIDELETENKTLKSAGEKARGDADTLRSENETLNKRNIDSEIKAGVDARLAMERTAATCLDGVDIKGKSDLEIKGLIIAKKFPEMKLDGKSNDYVDACFSNAVALITAENAKKGISSQRQKSSPKTAVKTDVDDTTEFTVDNADQDVARARMIKRMTSVPVSSEN